MKRKLYLLIVCTIAFCANTFAQSSIGTYQVRVSLDHADWKYELNQSAKFSIAVALNNSHVAGLPVKYSCGPEAMPSVIEKTVTTTAQPITIDTARMKQPGFYRCIATVEKEGKIYRGLATAGYRPDQIKPVMTEPADFDKFWNDGKAQLAKIPFDAKLELLPASGTSKVDVYHVSFQNVGTGISRISRIYGILCVPKDTSKKYPALLRVPGAGVRPYTGQIALAEQGIITLEIDVPGIYSWGYNDEVVPPTSSYAAFNVITAPKTLLLGLEMGHANSPEQTEQINDWLVKVLKEGKVQ